MDPKKAEQLYENVKGIQIEETTIEALIDSGKSAAVFRGKKDDNLFAIKIFDNDIVRKDDFEIQQQRINLELSLKDHKIPNLIKIIGGGETTIKGTEYYYLIMEYIEGKNLKKYIETESIDEKFIVKVANILIDVTEKLFQSKEPIVHRDIKPENIMVSKKGEIILMDMGVIKIVGNPSMTDIAKKEFLGTLRYAPPEFLMRKEEDSLNGWRAVNIYQIGAVLHDLIMKKMLYAGIEPYPAMVIAIKEDMPQVISTEYHPNLIQLTREMLHKDWKERLKLAPIDRVKAVLEKCLLPQDEPTNYYNKLKTNAQPIQNEIKKLEDIARSKEEKIKIMHKIHNSIWGVIEEIFIKNKDLIGMMNKIDSSKVFSTENFRHTLPIVNFKFYQLTGKLEYGFSRPFFLFFMVENNESSYARIYILGVIPNIITRERILEPERLVYELFSKEHRYPLPQERITNPPEIHVKLTCFFDGIVEFEDNSLQKIIDSKIGEFLDKITKEMEHEVKEELEQQKERLESDQRFFVSIKTAPGIIFVN